MGLFAKELAVGAPANECLGICQSSRPVEIRSKCPAVVYEKLRGSRTHLRESLRVSLCPPPC
jgi:hypothetical protein